MNHTKPIRQPFHGNTRPISAASRTQMPMNAVRRLNAIRVKLTPAEQTFFDRAIASIRARGAEGLERIAQMSVDDAVRALRAEMAATSHGLMTR